MQAKDELTRLQHKVLSSKDEAIQARDQTIAALEARLRDNNSLITMQGEIMRDRAFSMTVSETKGWTLNKSAGDAGTREAQAAERQRADATVSGFSRPWTTVWCARTS